MGMWFRITGYLRVWICNCGYVTIIYSNVWICNYWVLKSRVWKYSQGTSVEVSTGYANTLNLSIVFSGQGTRLGNPETRF